MEGASVSSAEGLLSDWFEAPVVLASSGRAAILLYLSETGHNRYKHRVLVPRLISACVLDALIRRSFPVDAESKGRHDTALLYHQYGFPQLFQPDGRTIEDICHAFFGSVESGARDWKGEVAVFSLPKFFSLSTMIGGLVVHDEKLAECLRQRRDTFEHRDARERRTHSEVWLNPVGGSRDALEIVYLQRLTNPQIHDDELAGIPQTLSDLREIGEKRHSCMNNISEATSCGAKDASPKGWNDWLVDRLPFAYPLFGEPNRLAPARDRFARIGVQTDLYQIDIARNMTSPKTQTALLLPCHHCIPVESMAAINTIVREL